MAQAKGSKSKLIYDTETTFNTTKGAPDAHNLPFVSESLRLTRNLIDSKSIRGSRNPQQPARGSSEVAGDITLELDPYIGKMLFNTFGTFSTTGAAPYSHTFKISDLPAGMMIEKQFPDLTIPEYFRFTGCKVNSMKIGIKPEGFIDATFSFMGAASTVTLASYDSTPTDYSVAAVGGTFDGFEATIFEGGSSLGIATEIDVTLENNLDGSIYVIDGTGKRYAIPEGMAKVSGNIKALFEDMTLYNKAVNNTETSLLITLKHGTGVGSAYNEKMDILIDEIILQPAAPVVTGPTGIMVELGFTGFYKDGARASAMSIVLWNTQTQLAIMA